MPLWIFTSAKIFPSSVKSTFQFLIASVTNFMTLSDMLYIFRNLLSSFVAPNYRPFYCQSTPCIQFSASLYSFWVCADQYSKSTVLVTLWLPFCSSETGCHIVTIFINPSARAGYDTRSIFKRNLIGLNSELSFS